MVKINITEIYPKVLSLVKSGYAIDQACRACEISRMTLYTKITDFQKQELRSEKSTLLTYGHTSSRKLPRDLFSED